MIGKKVVYACTECGTLDVLFDAWAEWDEASQQMVLHSSYDESYCTVCDGPCSVEKVDLNDDGTTNQGRADLSSFGF